MAVAARWEHGSEFHWLPDRLARPYAGHADSRQWLMTGSGRDALRVVLRQGAARQGWRRVLVPSFLCQEVVESILDEGFDVAGYEDDPRTPILMPDGVQGDAVLVVNTFGARMQPAALPRDAAVIEDHTHDPWSDWARQSQADYCIASLRKALPIPDGGLVWSPAGHDLPAAPDLTASHRLAAANKLEAMLLKGLYLAGHPVTKASFRALSSDGEQQIAAGEPSAVDPVSAAILSCMDLESWRQVRKRNCLHLTSLLAGAPFISVLEPEDARACPFSGVLIVDTPQRRDALRDFLIARDVYAAVLWPLEAARIPLPPASVSLSRRVLSLHCDGRYAIDDMTRVAGLVRDGLACAG